MKENEIEAKFITFNSDSFDYLFLFSSELPF